MRAYSDGVDRPDWYDGNELTRGIQEYFAAPVDAEIERLRLENAEMRARLAAPLAIGVAGGR